jgi:ABC-type Zn uptake system ZnuABC Zn-binding protein ZnuA
MNHKLWINLSILVSLILTACGSAAPSTTDTRLKVVATYSILGDLIQNVGGGKLDLRTLVGANGDAHTFQPSPADSAALANAALIFENGLGFEPWLDDLYAASGSKAQRIIVTEGISPHKFKDAQANIEIDEFDPHVWHSVANVIQMTKNVRDALVKADSVNAETYNQNAEAYIAQLQELETWVFAEVEKLPGEKRKLVTTHDTFGYFAERYGFEVVATALVSTESAEPSAEQIAALVNEIKATGVSAIFVENVSNPKLMEQIANEAGVKLGPPLYTDALGDPGSDGDTYLKLFRYNVTAIITALNR